MIRLVKPLILSTLFFASILSLTAQHDIGINLGFASYEGDLNERNFILPTEIHPLIGISYSRTINESLQAGILANISQLTGDDQNFDERKSWTPNYRFETPLTEVLINIKWSPFFKRKMDFYNENQERLDLDEEDYLNAWENVYDENGIKLFYDEENEFFHGKDANDKIYIYDQFGHLSIYNQDFELVESNYKKRIYPYLLVGAGISLYDQKPEISPLNDGNYIDYLQEDFESSYITGALGGGLGFDVSEKLKFEVDAAYRYAFSDLIDGISDTRDPDDNDWYLVGAIRVAYKLSSSKKSYIDFLR